MQETCRLAMQPAAPATIWIQTCTYRGYRHVHRYTDTCVFYNIMLIRRQDLWRMQLRRAITECHMHASACWFCHEYHQCFTGQVRDLDPPAVAPRPCWGTHTVEVVLLLGHTVEVARASIAYVCMYRWASQDSYQNISRYLGILCFDAQNEASNRCRWAGPAAVICRACACDTLMTAL